MPVTIPVCAGAVIAVRISWLLVTSVGSIISGIATFRYAAGQRQAGQGYRDDGDFLFHYCSPWSSRRSAQRLKLQDAFGVTSGFSVASRGMIAVLPRGIGREKHRTPYKSGFRHHDKSLRHLKPDRERFASLVVLRTVNSEH
jgi:hypothetical protein